MLPTCACGLPPDDGKLHVLDLDAHKQEVDLAEDHVLEVVPELAAAGTSPAYSDLPRF